MPETTCLSNLHWLEILGRKVVANRSKSVQIRSQIGPKTVKIRSQIDQKSSKFGLWSPLGFSWAPLGGQVDPKIDCWSILGSILGSLFGHFSDQNPVIFWIVFLIDFWSNFDRFWRSFLEVFWIKNMIDTKRADPWKTYVFRKVFNVFQGLKC